MQEIILPEIRENFNIKHYMERTTVRIPMEASFEGAKKIIQVNNAVQ